MASCSGYIQGYLLPTSDKSVGDWFFTPVYSNVNAGIDSASSNLGTYVETMAYEPASPFEVNLASGVTAVSNTCHILKYVASIDAYYGSENVPLKIDLYNGTSLIKTTSVSLSSTAWITGEINLTTGEAASITGYGQLSVRVSGANSAGGNTPRIAEIEFQYPTGVESVPSGNTIANIYPQAFLLFV